MSVADQQLRRDRPPRSAASNRQPTVADETEALLRIGHLAQRTATQADAWPALLGELRGAFNSSASAIEHYDFSSKSSRLILTDGYDDAFIRSYEEYYCARNVWLGNAALYSAVNALVPGEELVAEDQLVRSEFYTGWLAPQNKFHRVAGVLSRAGDTLVLLSLVRPRAAGRFEAEELERLQRVCPMIGTAVDVRTRLETVGLERDIAVESLDRLRQAIIVVDSRCRPVHLNRGAEELLARADGIALRNGGLAIASNVEATALEQLVQDAAGDATRGVGALTVSRPSGMRDYALFMAPLAPGEALFNGTRAVAALFLVDPEEMGAADEARLRQFYGLTPTEARLAALIACGNSIEEVAAELGITTGTARVHLKHVFSKTHTGRQAELVHLVLSSTAQIRPATGAKTA